MLPYKLHSLAIYLHSALVIYLPCLKIDSWIISSSISSKAIGAQGRLTNIFRVKSCLVRESVFSLRGYTCLGFVMLHQLV